MHKTRVAARRLRSTLRIFADVVEAAPAEELDNELKWYADLLGQVRDRDVLSSRLVKQIADLPPEHVRGPVEAEIMKTLDAGLEDAVRRLDRAMRTRRYRHLMRLLRGWRAGPPLTDTASQDGAAAVDVCGKGPAKSGQATTEEPATTSNSCIEPERRSNGRGTPLNSSNRPTVRCNPSRGTSRRCKPFLASIKMPLSPPSSSPTMSADEDIEAGSALTYGVLMANELNRAAEIRASLRN